MLKSSTSAKITADMIQKVKSGGFNITKVSSNHVEIFKSIPDEYRKDGVKDKDSNLGILPEDKALGVKWNIQEDTQGVKIRFFLTQSHCSSPIATNGFGSVVSPLFCPACTGSFLDFSYKEVPDL